MHIFNDIDNDMISSTVEFDLNHRHNVVANVLRLVATRRMHPAAT